MTDHRLVSTDIQLSNFVRGTSYGKCNDGLLGDDDFIKMINDRIDEHQEGNFLSKNTSLEILKSKLKAFSMAYSIKKNRERKEKERLIESEIEKLTSIVAKKPEDPDCTKKNSLN